MTAFAQGKSPAKASHKPLRIAHIEISRFRRLQSVRLDLEKDMTVLVGANNSGKTAAITALRLFLHDRKGFSPYDIGAENWITLRGLGKSWEGLMHDPTLDGSPDSGVSWESQLTLLHNAMPTLDLWLDVHPGYFHHVTRLIPSLDWSGGLLGVRLRLEPATSVTELQGLAWSYRQARLLAVDAAEHDAKAASRVWPTDLLDFWLRLPAKLGAVAAYKLDPKKLVGTDQTYQAQPQVLPNRPVRVKDDVLRGVIRVDFIPAQRGLGTEEAGEHGNRAGQRPGMFSRQVVELAKRRFDRTSLDFKGQRVMQAAVAKAQVELDEAIADALSDVTEEVRSLGYPGLHDPQDLVFRSWVQPAQLLNHSTAVQYGIDEGSGAAIHIPEHGIGLGYQNLQALNYQLCAFRDERIAGANAERGEAPEPVHLVLVEEPEAHLHVQAQRVFVTRAYHLLKAERADQHLWSQLLVSTHSSHVAHAVPFAKLRYVRRATPTTACMIPGSAIIGLNDVFGDDEETQDFAERYLRIQHSDLLFADAAVFVEGTAERLLVPAFVERDWSELASRYLSYLEVGGSHAHRLRPLVERLGLPTLIITDLDPATLSIAQGGKTSKAKAPVDSKVPQISTNPTLTKWHPGEESVTKLLALDDHAKEKDVGSWPDVRVRFAYQVSGKPGWPCGSSFEDAFVLENTVFFQALEERSGPMEAMRCAAVGGGDPKELHKILGNRFDKAQFALDLLSEVQDNTVRCPRYIHDGLAWLQQRLIPPKKPRTTSKTASVV